ncbi:alginate O-acetyltransferase AlgF [Bordetella trematum]|uniref:alginate O-acetyltransferase AlgF n=1 Tax=Bordetella trematum TaxID=123899 RepID=UPI003AF3FF57
MKNGLNVLMFVAAFSCITVQAAEVPLYETGPAEDSSFVRFVNGSEQPLDVVASRSKSRVTLDGGRPVTDFQAIQAGKPVEGVLRQGALEKKISVTAQPGEFVTVVGLENPSEGLRTVVIHEQPDDFNALKASVAIYNLDAQCVSAALLVAGRDIVLFEQVPENAFRRRQINPVPLKVQLSCGGQITGKPVDLGILEAGQRYTVFLVPDGKQSRLFSTEDIVAH